MASNEVHDVQRRKMKSLSYGDDLISTLQSLRDRDELCDFTVSAQGRDFKVHKTLLAATSDYFRIMFTGPMRESKESYVDLKGLTGSGLEHIIDFLYSGETEIDMDNLNEVLNAASHLQVKSAMDLCSDYMIKLLTFENAEELMHIADTYTLAKVVECYDSMVLQNFYEFSRTERFLKLTGAQLCIYLASDSLKVQSESDLLTCVLRWYEADPVRHVHLEDVLSTIRFCLISENDLIQLQHHQLLQKYQGSVNFIGRGMSYHTEGAVGHPTLGKDTRPRACQHALVLVHHGNSFKPFEITAFDPEGSKFYQLITDISGSRDCRVSSIDNFVYISQAVDCGGGSLMSALIRFDPRHCKLQQMNPCRHVRVDPALIAFEKKLFLFGGTSESYAVLDFIEVYDIYENTWRELLPLPVPMHSHAAVVHGKYIYISGGISAQARAPTGNLLVYDPSTYKWDYKPDMHFARRLHEMASICDSIYVVGGIGIQGYPQQAQIPIEILNPDNSQWTILTTTLAGRSVGHFICFQKTLFSVGREHKQATEDEVWKYDAANDTWRAFIKVPRPLRLSSVLCSLGYIDFNNGRLARSALTDKK